MATKDSKTPVKEGEVASETNEEEPTALYDQPLIVEGKRKRRSVDLFVFSSPRDTPKVKETQYKGGDGAKLGDIAIIQHNITKTKAEDLKLLYKLCYESSISVTSMVIKKGLRSFSGWSFTEDSDEFEKRVSQLERLTIPILNTLLDLLSLDKHGNKADLIARILTFLSKPVDNGIPIPEPKKRRKSSIEKSGGPTKKSKVDEDEGTGPDTEKGNEGEKEDSGDKDNSKMETEETPSVATGTGPVTTDDVSKDDDEKERDEDNEGERKEDGETKDSTKQDTDTPIEGEENNVSNDKPLENSSSQSETNNKLTSGGKDQSVGGDKPVTTSTEE